MTLDALKIRTVSGGFWKQEPRQSVSSRYFVVSPTGVSTGSNRLWGTRVCLDRPGLRRGLAEGGPSGRAVPTREVESAPAPRMCIHRTVDPLRPPWSQSHTAKRDGHHVDHHRSPWTAPACPEALADRERRSSHPRRAPGDTDDTGCGPAYRPEDGSLSRPRGPGDPADRLRREPDGP